MPLSFQRPYNSLFSGQRTNVPATPQTKNIEQPTALHDFLSFYPLATEKRGSGGVQAVTPLRQASSVSQNSQLLAQATHMQKHQQQNNRQNPMQNLQTAHPQMSLLQNQHSQAPNQRLNQPAHQASPSPQAAANHFRNINKNLPDGVMYEPLDEETTRLLKENALMKPTEKPTENKNGKSPRENFSEKTIKNDILQTSPMQPASTNIELNAITSTLINLAQDEQNAYIFYSGIVAPTSEAKETLKSLASGCEMRCNQYTQILKSHFERNFTPEIKIINTALPFHEAISLALLEESKALTSLGNLLDQVQDTSLERLIERLINKKIIAHQVLLLLRA